MCTERSQEKWEQVEHFDEVPVRLLDPARWAVTGSGLWRRLEDISVLEARSLANRVRALALSRVVSGKRLLFLADNMGDVFAFARSRTKNYRILTIIRRTVA